MPDADHDRLEPIRSSTADLLCSLKDALRQAERSPKLWSRRPLLRHNMHELEKWLKQLEEDW